MTSIRLDAILHGGTDESAPVDLSQYPDYVAKTESLQRREIAKECPRLPKPQPQISFKRLWRYRGAVVTSILSKPDSTDGCEIVDIGDYESSLTRSTDRMVINSDGMWEAIRDGVAHVIPFAALPEPVVAMPAPPPLPPAPTTPFAPLAFERIESRERSLRQSRDPFKRDDCGIPHFMEW
jgi:hypothetical protein